MEVHFRVCVFTHVYSNKKITIYNASNMAETIKKKYIQHEYVYLEMNGGGKRESGQKIERSGAR